MVFALTVLDRRMATIVVQITAGIRLFQYQPALAGGASATPETLPARGVPGAAAALRSARRRPRARGRARRDRRSVRRLPVRLRPAAARAELKELGEVAERVIETAPQLADGFVLRGEHAARTGGTTGKQAFTEAISARAFRSSPRA